MGVGRVVAGLLLLFAAYVVGRAAGILLDVNPWLTEAVAIAAVVAVYGWLSLRRT